MYFQYKIEWVFEIQSSQASSLTSPSRPSCTTQIISYSRHIQPSSFFLLQFNILQIFINLTFDFYLDLMLDGKENIEGYPKKQGILYAISTGKNNGVYLSKDITHDNHKSLTLLTSQARQAHKSYVHTLELISKQPQNSVINSKRLCDVESFEKNWHYFQKNIKVLGNVSYQFSLIQKNLRNELQRLHERISNQNTQVLNSCSPALKSLRERIKIHKGEQSAIFSKIKRQVQSMEQCFLLVEKGIKQCDKKMDICQQIYGCQHQQLE